MIVKKKLNKKNKEKRVTNWKRFFRRIIFIFLVVSFGLILVWVLFLSPLLEVKKILVLGTEKNQKEIEKIVWSNLEENLFSFKSYSLLLFSSSQTKQEILSRFPLIKEIEIKKQFPDQLIIEIFPRSKVIIWCSKDDCYLIDEEGKAFKRIEEIEKKESFTKFPVLIEDNSHQIQLGEKVFSTELVEFVFSLENNFKNILKLEIKNSLVTPSFVSGEIKVEIKEFNLPIFLNSTVSSQKQLENILALLNKIGREKLTKFEYIDSRIEGKLIYKLREIEEEKNENRENLEESSDNRKKEKKKNPAFFYKLEIFYI